MSMAEESVVKLPSSWQRINRSLNEGWGATGNMVAALLFLAGVFAYVFLIAQSHAMSGVVIAAGVTGAYMALNIGANDVANNMGPAVGSKSLSMSGALVIAALFEASGAIIAGGDVVSTISKGIIAPDQFATVRIFIWAMMAALMAAAVWVNLATVLNAPVSTTHAVVGGVAGAGIAASGFGAVDWHTMGLIAASWVISPIMGGTIAAIFLFILKGTVLFRDEKLEAARRWVPVFIAVLAGAFAVYLAIKGLKHIWKPPLAVVLAIGVAAFLGTLAAGRSVIARQAQGLDNKRKAVNGLFAIPLICGAALLSFAHGANDVANAVGPFAAIVTAATNAEVAAKAQIPGWVMVVGALGIAAGLLLYGRRLIRVVGKEITKLDQSRAFCVALAAAVTVLVASWLGLPVSSTHIAVGGIFGVGFLREYLYKRVSLDGKWLKKKKRKKLKRRLVRRRHLISIAAAWVITVPAAALIAAGLFLALNRVFD